MHWAARMARNVGAVLACRRPTEEGDFEDLVTVDECDDGEAWVPSESCCLTGAE
jgi:hypothetical protein